MLLLAAAIIVSLTVRSRAATREEAWLQLNSLNFENVEEGRQSIRKLQDLSQSAPSPEVGQAALMQLGSQALRLAQLVDMPPDAEFNQSARYAFEQLLARFAASPLAFGMAHNGLATVEENEFVLDRDLAHRDKARDHLGAVVGHSTLTATPYHRMASDRLAQLDDVFTIVRFAAAPEVVEEAKAEPEAVDEAPAGGEIIQQRLEIRPDGTVVPVETP